MTDLHTDRIATDDEYVLAVYQCVTKKTRYDHRFGDDVAQRCVIRLLGRVDHFRSRYPSPQTLAGVLWATELLDHYRSERVQRAEGARAGGGRRSVAVELLDEPGVVNRTCDDYARIDDRDELLGYINGLSPQIGRLLWLVAVEGCSIAEAASMVGWSREHASRQLAKLADTTVQNQPTGPDGRF